MSTDLVQESSREHLRELARWFGWPFIALPVVGVAETLVMLVWRVLPGGYFTMSGGPGDCLTIVSTGNLVAIAAVLVFGIVMTRRRGAQAPWTSLVFTELFRLTPMLVLSAVFLPRVGDQPDSGWNLWNSALLWLSLFGLTSLLTALWMSRHIPRPRPARLLALMLGTGASLALLSFLFPEGSVFYGQWVLRSILWHG